MSEQETEVMALLQRMQQQLTYLEKKLDTLIHQSQPKPFNREGNFQRPYRPFRPNRPEGHGNSHSPSHSHGPSHHGHGPRKPHFGPRREH